MTTPWIPENEQDIISGIQNGTIRETHRMEVKATARPDTIAITIASLAIDGGTFILGIEEITEDGRKRLSPKPLDLTGLPEKVDVIARNSIDPPMAVHSRQIPSLKETGLGFLVIEVDPSPAAPHMANGSYYGRGETSRHKLSDQDVLRYHQLRIRQAEQADALLDQEEERDYLTQRQSARGHLYLVAEPLGRMPAAGQTFLRNAQEVSNVLRNSSRSVYPNAGPYPRDAVYIQERNAGFAFVTSQANGPGRKPNAVDHAQRAWEPHMLDIEVQRSGGIRVYQSSATVPYDNDTQVVRDAMMLEYSRNLIAWLAALEPHTQYNGHWALGIRATRLRSLRSLLKADAPPHEQPGGMDTDTYSRTTIASTRDIQERPETVVAALVGDLLRVLGTASHYHLKR